MRYYFIFVAAILGAVFGACAQSQLDEYQVKAAFLYNFAKFVEWNADAFKDATDPIVICIAGDTLISRPLEAAVTGKMVESRAFVVRKVSDAPHAGGCHILFISSGERKRSREILGGLKASGTLTVGETPGFISDGGIINFKLDGGKVRFEINADAAGQERLRISSKLLSLAQIVKK
jgi:hypothetical protein